ncbi:hypothetical protein BH20BAC1_BH20BAC1_25260 [soil metagenome]
MIKNKKVAPIKVKSGRLPYLHDSRTLKLKNYLSREDLAKIPSSYNWGKKIEPDKWGHLGNLKINNCTCAAAAHLIMNWTANIGKIKRPTMKSVIQSYAELTGYNPKTDGIGNPIEAIKALKFWRKKGIAGHKIIAFAKLDFKDEKQLKQAIYLYGGCYIGMNLPESAEQQYYDSKKWTVPRSGLTGAGTPGSWMGHAMIITGYNKNDLRAITWGKEMIMTIAFWKAYVDESYTIFSGDFIKDDKTPTNISEEILMREIMELKKND